MEPIVPQSSGGGNTKTPPQISPALHWILTWNNYPKDWEKNFEFQRSKISLAVFGKEVGESGTPHIQGYIKFKTKTRPKDLFAKEIHWEKCRCPREAITYCMKDNDYILWGIKQPYKLSLQSLYSWQEELINIIEKEPDDRTIHWRWSREGKIGKTTFAKYLYTNYKRVIVLGGKKDDMCNGLIEYQENQGCLPRVVIIDIPRSAGEAISWGGIEAVKNMFFYSGKYKGGMCCGENPHVICFANKEPEWEKMSEDRWDVKELE